jgi:hypothetical protein
VKIDKDLVISSGLKGLTWGSFYDTMFVIFREIYLMQQRYLSLLAKSQPKVKVLAQAYDQRKLNLVWLSAFATAAFMAIFYFFGLFFGFSIPKSKWRVLLMEH